LFIKDIGKDLNMSLKEGNINLGGWGPAGISSSVEGCCLSYRSLSKLSSGGKPLQNFLFLVSQATTHGVRELSLLSLGIEKESPIWRNSFYSTYTISVLPSKCC